MSGQLADDVLLSDQAIIDRVLEHATAGTTDLGDSVRRVPVENYSCERRFALEQELFRRMPMVYCPSAALAETGAYVAREHAGMPLLVVRGADGVVRAFHNACRHRGMMLAEGHGKVNAGFVCRYHAWAYGLEGELRGIAGVEGFPGVDPAEHGLKRVACEERGGFVFVTLKEPIGPGALESLPQILTDDQVVFDYNTFVDDANWKLLKEFSMEGYHIKALHKKSFYPYGYDNLNIVEKFGPNSRITFPFNRIEKLRDKPRDQWRAAGMLTFVNQVFPNTRVSILSNHCQMVTLEPISPEQTRWHIYRLTLSGASTDAESLEQSKRDAEFVKDTGLVEDRQAACSSQASLAGEGNSHFTFGLYESAVVHFHQHLDDRVAQVESVLD